MRLDLINAISILWDAAGLNDPEVQMTGFLWIAKTIAFAL